MEEYRDSSSMESSMAEQSRGGDDAERSCERTGGLFLSSTRRRSVPTRLRPRRHSPLHSVLINKASLLVSGPTGVDLFE
jgi:hypothetical protein